MTDRIRVAVLGSTGSIGRQTLQVAAAHPDRIEIVSLAANSSTMLLAEQATAFGVKAVAIASDEAAASLRIIVADDVTVTSGAAAVVALAEQPDVDIVLNALVGAAGLRATIAALTANKTLALANKESLVVGGELVTRLVRPGKLLPVDSEHSAIFQCLLGESAASIARIWLTASGGPFRGWRRDALVSVTVRQALAHPRWTMGPKITIDSATLMNKGLETIEAHHLFGVGYDRISIVVHPQSTVHSLVEFSDGSVKGHLGVADMRVPIQYALSHPERWEAPVPPLDLTALGSLSFEAPDLETFRCLALALEAGRTGGTLPAAMNAANEVAVAAFLSGRLGFTGIDSVVETVMNEHGVQPVESFEQLEEIDAVARRRAKDLVAAS